MALGSQWGESLGVILFPKSEKWRRARGRTPKVAGLARQLNYQNDRPRGGRKEAAPSGETRRCSPPESLAELWGELLVGDEALLLRQGVALRQAVETAVAVK